MPSQTIQTSAVRGTPDPTSSSRAVPPARIDLGEIDDLRVLDENGEVNEALDPGLPDDELLRVYRAMVLTRKFDIRMLNMQRQGEMGTFAPGFGQEATQIGQVYPLAQRDWYSPSYRSFGAQIWRGWPMDQLFLLWDGFFEGFAPPPDVNDLPFSIVIGSHVPLAVGIAMGIRKKGVEDAVVVCNFGDGASSQGIVSESMNFAAVFKAPCVFVVENNGWAISTKLEQQSGVTELARRGPAFGVPSVRVDGNDILGMIAASTRAVEHARAGHGPYLIEAVTYRMGVHTTADDPKVYRSDDEVRAWEGKCPIRRMERHLTERGLLDAETIETIGTACEQEVLAARESFRKRAIARPEEIFDFVYEELPPELAAQRDEYLRRLGRA
ncbi:MAG: thiamine pyrophosphate-dependent dehydrogenase E1 component subunit alpha [Phycisphaerales bacterium]|nr:thiamine pyrophosphate-dependent dehydrogenase E1 component subunit alpha [Phycisphaerales bacterium]